MHAHRHESRSHTAPGSAGLTARTLFQQLVRASAALDQALEAVADAPEALQEAREALDAFELLERSATDLVVPREIRRRLREAVHYLETDHLELARADVGRAGSAFERYLLGRPTH